METTSLHGVLISPYYVLNGPVVANVHTEMADPTRDGTCTVRLRDKRSYRQVDEKQ